MSKMVKFTLRKCQKDISKGSKAYYKIEIENI